MSKTVKKKFSTLFPVFACCLYNCLEYLNSRLELNETVATAVAPMATVRAAAAVAVPSFADEAEPSGKRRIPIGAMVWGPSPGLQGGDG